MIICLSYNHQSMTAIIAPHYRPIRYVHRGSGPLDFLKLLALPRIVKSLFPGVTRAFAELDRKRERSRREMGLGRRRRRGRGLMPVGGISAVGGLLQAMGRRRGRGVRAMGRRRRGRGTRAMGGFTLINKRQPLVRIQPAPMPMMPTRPHKEVVVIPEVQKGHPIVHEPQRGRPVVVEPVVVAPPPAKKQGLISRGISKLRNWVGFGARRRVPLHPRPRKRARAAGRIRIRL